MKVEPQEHGPFRLSGTGTTRGYPPGVTPTHHAPSTGARVGFHPAEPNADAQVAWNSPNDSTIGALAGSGRRRRQPGASLPRRDRTAAGDRSAAARHQPDPRPPAHDDQRDPLCDERERRTRAPHTTCVVERGRGAPPPVCSSDEVYFLPGTIDISRVRKLQEIERVPEGRELVRRHMVRGHWRRAQKAWADQRLRWIEPYWKGPDMAAIIEHAYRLKP